MFETSSPGLNEVRVQHLTKLEMSSPDLSEVRVQRLVLVGTVNASPSEVRAHLQSVFLSVFNRLKGFRLKAVRLENLQSVFLSVLRGAYNLAKHHSKIAQRRAEGRAYNPAKHHSKIAQRRAGGPQSSVLSSVLLGILHTGDKKLAVTNLSSEGRVLERFHHLLALLIID